MANYIDIDRLRTIWKGMRSRCSNPRDKSYRYYGERSIEVCEEWASFERFAGWAVVNGYSDAKEIDRIESDRHYEPGNCRWISAKLNRSRRAVPGATRLAGEAR
tara:strand:+ start:30824 stop:31135 length:312 start_codon:yes stop_codon:yes gene_type:complete